MRYLLEHDTKYPVHYEFKGVILSSTTLEYRELKIRGITVPIGFEFDGASHPILFNLFIRKLGRGGIAWLVHDYLYSKYSQEHYPKIERSDADVIMYQILLDEAAALSGFKRYWHGLKYSAAFIGVRLFGWLFWRKE